jgi:hypothetical protein
METESVLSNHGPWRKMHQSFVENTGHDVLVSEVTDGLRIAGPCPALRGIIPVSRASGRPAVMFE